MVDVAFFGRWSAVQLLPVLIDCANNRHAQLGGGVTFGENGEVKDAKWTPLTQEEGLYQIICEGTA